MTGNIDKLKLTKPTQEGNPRWRFNLAADVLGYTVWIPGWTYLPRAAQGYRVNPPQAGRYNLILGAREKTFAKVLEGLVEEKLKRRGEELTTGPETADYTPEELAKVELLAAKGEL